MAHTLNTTKGLSRNKKNTNGLTAKKIQITTFYLYPNSENTGNKAPDTANNSSILGGLKKEKEEKDKIH